MRNLKHSAPPFNDLPLWRAARARRFCDLPVPAKRLARQIGCEPEVVRLVAELAGLKGGSS